MINLREWKQWPVIRPIIATLFSRKFVALALVALASTGLDITPEMQALIFALAGVAFALLTAWEDSAAKRGGNGPE